METGLGVRMRLLSLTVVVWIIAACRNESPTGRGLASAGAGPNAYPKTCAEVAENVVATKGPLEDGVFTLYMNRSSDLAWRAYCRGMRWESPEEYITVDPALNFSEGAYGGVAVMVTRYTMLRIRPATLEVDALDAWGAVTANGSAAAKRTHLPAGVAQSAAPGMDARGSVDLRGSGFGFEVAATPGTLTCVNNGTGTASEATLGLDRDRVTLRAQKAAAATMTTAWVQHGCDPSNSWSVIPAALVWRVRYTGR